MTVRARTVSVTIVFGLAAATASLSAQAPHELSAYALVEAGRVPVPNPCSCVTAPFTVRYPPGGGVASGPAQPIGAVVPIFTARHVAEDRATFSTRAEEGLAGNPGASMRIAMHLSLESAMAGMSARTEEEASRWLHLAAAQDSFDAFRLLGFRYSHGRGVAQNDGAAAYWFHQGATRGDAISMVALGLRYAAGRGVAQNWNAAVSWWRRAQARAPLASRFLGDAYACGLGIEPDSALAVAAYKAAAEAGERSASTQLGHLYAKGCAGPDDAAAVNAYERSADDGDPEAQVALSDLVRQGRGTEPNPYRAYTLARLAELRLPEGALKALAAERVRSAVRLMNPEAIRPQEAMVRSMIAAAASPVR